MKYYLVNFLVFHANTIMEDATIALAVDMNVYDGTTAFKKIIGKQPKYLNGEYSIVIKTYRQISEDIYLLVHPFVKNNNLGKHEETNRLHVSYNFTSSDYSK